MHRPRIDIGSWGDIIQRVLFMTGKHSSVQRRQTLKAYGFMTPALIIIILFTIIPIIGSLVLMFYDYSVLGQTKFVGLKNFVKAFHDRVFWISIKNPLFL